MMTIISNITNDLSSHQCVVILQLRTQSDDLYPKVLTHLVFPTYMWCEGSISQRHNLQIWNIRNIHVYSQSQQQFYIINAERTDDIT